MDLRVLLLVLCITFTSVQGAAPKCCLQISRVPLSMLVEVDSYTVQTRKGACDIEALVLHYKGKNYCAPMRAKKVIEKLKHKPGANAVV